MDRLFLHALTGSLALAFFLSMSPLAQAQDTTMENEASADIVQTAKKTDGFATLVSALEAADLVNTLKGEGPFTVFAPTDEAFAALPDGTLDELLKPENKSKLQSILTYHVVEETVMANKVTSMTEANTLEGSKVSIDTTAGTVTLMGKNQATVTKTDIRASNGVIHVIDAVLMPATTTAVKN